MYISKSRNQEVKRGKLLLIALSETQQTHRTFFSLSKQPHTGWDIQTVVHGSKSILVFPE